MNEEWRPVVGYEGFYEVSSLGRVRSLTRVVMRKNGSPLTVNARILAACVRGDRRLQVSLHRDGDYGKVLKVHVLVAAAFLGPRPEGFQVCHNDGDCQNNRATNLRYGTPESNTADRIRHGQYPQMKKTSCKWGHPFTPANTRLYNGRRNCVACTLRRAGEQHARERLAKVKGSAA